MNSVVDEIKQKLDLVEVIGDYVKLAKAGRNFKARCPFHNERTPSFMVSSERQIWRCFGCNRGGDIFAFIKEIEGVEFADALRTLARKAGVVLKRENPQVQSQRRRLYEICDLASRFYEAQLEKSSSGQEVLAYLLGRGLLPQTIKTWRLGWAPASWRTLFDFLRGRGYREDEIGQAGLIIEKDSPAAERSSAALPRSYYDRFRSRIIFPIFDIQGQVVGFGGRIFGQEANQAELAKYINTPQTPLYDKSHLLYGLHQARHSIRQKDSGIIVEGYMDLIMSHQAGIANAVASSGTALTEGQLNILGRYSKNLAVAFDSDAAGQSATRRSLELALAQDFEVKVIMMKDKDPADVVKKNPADWQQTVERGQSVRQFYFASAFGQVGLGSSGSSFSGNGLLTGQKKEIIKILLPVIKLLPSRVEQSEWLRELAAKLHVEERDLALDLQRVKAAGPKTAAATANWAATASPKPVQRQAELEERIIGLCLICSLIPEEFFSFSAADFQDTGLAQIFEKIVALSREPEKDDLSKRLKEFLPPDLEQRFEEVLLKTEQQPPAEEETEKELVVCLGELLKLKRKKELNALGWQIKEAQSRDDKESLPALLERFRELSAGLM